MPRRRASAFAAARPRARGKDPHPDREMQAMTKSSTLNQRPLPPVATPAEVADTGRIRIGAAVGTKPR